jgi:hypothetical protein
MLGAEEAFGRFAERTIPVPPLEERPGLLIASARFIIMYWAFGSVVTLFIGSLVAIVCVAFDSTYSRLQRLAWAIGFLLGQTVTVVLYCVLSLLEPRARHPSAAA